MFHTYARAASGNVIDLNRAQFLMDKSLIREAIKKVDALPPFGYHVDPEAFSLDQAFFDIYCELHRKKYGQSFTPDVDPNWS